VRHYCTPAMAHLITVSELVDRAAPPTEDHRSVWLRRARLWSVGDILPTATPQGGARKHRVYRESTVFLAAILFRISDFGVTTEILRELSLILKDAGQGKTASDRAWRRIKRGVPTRYRARDGFIEIVGGAYISVKLPRKGEPIQVGFTDKGLSTHLIPKDDAPAIILNLAKLWEELSERTADKEGLWSQQSITTSC
jgi:hypothetical protein